MHGDLDSFGVVSVKMIKNKYKNTGRKAHIYKVILKGSGQIYTKMKITQKSSLSFS